MNIKNVDFKKPARDRILRGIDTLTDAVASTLGAEGRTVIIETGGDSPIITKDGVTVAKAIIPLDDPLENIGATLIKQAASKTVDSVGDGTTTSTVLARAIIKNAIAKIDAGSSPVDVKKGIDDMFKSIVDKLNDMSTDVTAENITDVAIISTNNDVELGNLISEAFTKAGDNGLVIMETSENEITYVDYVDGMSLGRGYESSFFITDESKQRAVLTNPYILILDIKVDRIDEILKFIEAASKKNRPLLIVGELEDKIVKVLAQNKVVNNLKICVVKPSMFGERKREMLQDLAIATGGIMVSDETGDNLFNVGLDAMGTATSAIVTSDDTILTLDKEEYNDTINARIASLNTRIENSESEVEKGLLKGRLSNLNGGVSIIKVGASSDVELKEKKDRVDDAIHAVKASMQEGIVAGGGVALFSIGNSLVAANEGGVILLESIKEPFRQILKNAGMNPTPFEKDVTDVNGVNVKTKKIVNMLAEGIIDPVKVTRKALENAVSVAGTIILTDTVISIARDK